MCVVAFEAVTGIKIRAAFVIFPDFVVAGLARRRARCALLENIPLRVAFQFQVAWLVRPVEAVGEDDQDFAFGFDSGFHG